PLSRTHAGRPTRIATPENPGAAIPAVSGAGCRLRSLGFQEGCLNIRWELVVPPRVRATEPVLLVPLRYVEQLAGDSASVLHCQELRDGHGMLGAHRALSRRSPLGEPHACSLVEFPVSAMPGHDDVDCDVVLLDLVGQIEAHCGYRRF